MKENIGTKQIVEIIIVAIFIFATAIVSIFAGYMYAGINGETAEECELEYSASVQEFIKEYNRILDNYYLDVDEDILIKGAIRGMLEALEDEHTSLLDESDYYRFQQRVQGFYEGIGIGLYDDDDDQIVVSTVFENTPAERAGVHVRDILIEIDDIDLGDKDSQFLVEHIRDSEGDSVELTVLRAGDKITFEIEKETVILPSVHSQIIDEGPIKIGYLNVSVFALNTYGQFQNHLEKVMDLGVEGLIIDLRYNTGGYLSTAEKLLSVFLDKDKVIYKTDENGVVQSFYAKGDETTTYPIVILGNKHSASASEIMIAAMQEAYNAPFVGETTYGKGTVQEIVDLSDGDSLKYTARKWLTPDGNWIDDIGIKPDYEVEQDLDFYLSFDPKDDRQLQKAIEVFIDLIQ